MHRRLFFLSLLIAGISLYLFSCQQEGSIQQQSLFQNVYDTSAHYVGMQTCKGCHADIYATFMETGMGQSWDKATPSKSKAHFGDNQIVYDSINNLYYHPYWKDSVLHILEYRKEGGQIVHQRDQVIDYIVGSGQHTNSHLFRINNYLYQAPITFYTQLGIWDLAPGFEKGQNSKFTRPIQQECITCHNFYPTVDAGAENRYTSIPNGIQCERCHGPGSLHVAQKQKGILVDIKSQTDYSIVNPRKLDRERQISVCQRCHLQGITVLNEGKTFFDFRPGMLLSEVMHTFVPRYSDSIEHFIMASHADRMKMSRCFQKSEMTCLSCHNPHISVKKTNASFWDTKCLNCHTPKTKMCKGKDVSGQVPNKNCVSCHMPMSGSKDIPHVQIHDHNIRKPLSKKEINSIAQFVRLVCVSDQPSPGALTEANAFLNFFEEYEANTLYLSKAAALLNAVDAPQQKERWISLLIRLNFLKEDYSSIIHLSSQYMSLLSETDAWTNYRIGEAFLHSENYASAIPYLKRACLTQARNLDFINKLGEAYFKNKQLTLATTSFKQVLSLNPSHISANVSLAWCEHLSGNDASAIRLYKTALQLNPDYYNALVGLTQIYVIQKNFKAAKPLLLRAKKLKVSELTQSLEQTINIGAGPD